jgi:RNA polymerase primary sigma factor
MRYKVIATKDAKENILSLYLKDINKVNLMNREEEERIASRAAKGDAAAKDKLINANLRFVVSIAKKYRNQGLPIEDLISEGNIGLINAIEKFDVSKGYHFISYAVWWIRQAILKGISEKARAIRLPMNRIYEISKIERTRQNIQDKNGLDARVDEIAKELDMKKEHISDLLNISREMVSLDTPVFVETDSSVLKDFIVDDLNKTPTDILSDNLLKDEINKLLEDLPLRESEIIEHRFGLNGKDAMSLMEIGNKFNLTKERIRQIEKRALDRIKNNERVKYLKAYLS